MLPPSPGNGWHRCRFLTCSVLPVRMACPCECPFCFSRSSVSALAAEPTGWADAPLAAHFRWARSRGAARMVVTGGGEPLLRPAECIRAVRLAAPVFGEIAVFTSGAPLTAAVAAELKAAGLSYLCWSRHAVDDADNRALMGAAAPDAAAVLAMAADAGLPVRATCVMNAAGVADAAGARHYLDAFAALGVREFTFKHTYVAGDRSLFASSPANQWARRHRVETDPLRGLGRVVAVLPWGPRIRRIEEVQACHYFEPTPEWELSHRLARSSNLLPDGTVYASLEDHTSRLHRLSSPTTTPANRSSTPVSWPAPSRPTTSKGSVPCCPSATAPAPAPIGTPSPG
ncbi:MAG: radical SAM protein [Acidimicrobiia bacterium]